MDQVLFSEPSTKQRVSNINITCDTDVCCVYVSPPLMFFHQDLCNTKAPLFHVKIWKYDDIIDAI